MVESTQKLAKMVLVTLLGLIGVLFSYYNGTPWIAVGVSSVSLLVNYSLITVEPPDKK